MTAPVSGTRSLISTILTLKQLQQEDAKQQLLRDQLGVTRAATNEQMLGHLGALASSLPDAKVMLPHIESLAKSTGLDPEVLTTIFSNAVPGSDVTKSSVIAKGVKEAGDTINQPAAFSNLVGQQPSELGATGELNDLHKFLFQGAHQYLSSLPPEGKQAFGASVAQKVANGQTVGEALQDQLFAALPQEEQIAAIKIGKGLAPSASEIIQGRLGAARLKIDENIASANAAYQQAQIEAAMAEAQSKLKGTDLSKATELLKSIQVQQQFLTKQASTLTEEGKIQNIATLNSFYKQLRQIDPALGAYFQDVPVAPGKTPDLAAPGVGSAIIQTLRNKGGAP